MLMRLRKQVGCAEVNEEAGIKREYVPEEILGYVKRTSDDCPQERRDRVYSQPARGHAPVAGLAEHES